MNGQKVEFPTKNTSSITLITLETIFLRSNFNNSYVWMRCILVSEESPCLEAYSWLSRTSTRMGGRRVLEDVGWTRFGVAWYNRQVVRCILLELRGRKFWVFFAFGWVKRRAKSSVNKNVVYLFLRLWDINVPHPHWWKDRLQPDREGSWWFGCQVQRFCTQMVSFEVIFEVFGAQVATGLWNIHESSVSMAAKGTAQTQFTEAQVIFFAASCGCTDVLLD